MKYIIDSEYNIYNIYDEYNTILSLQNKLNCIFTLLKCKLIFNILDILYIFKTYNKYSYKMNYNEYFNTISSFIRKKNLQYYPDKLNIYINMYHELRFLWIKLIITYINN